MRFSASLAGALISSALLTLQAQSQAPTQPPASPVFRAGTDVVQLDVSVLDRDRRPVRHLKADDFTVLEDGRPQAIVAFQTVDIPVPVVPSTPWMREVAPDVATNRVVSGRLVVVVLPPGFDYWQTEVASRVADTIMGMIGPEDLVAVVYSRQNDHAQNFTADRARIRAALTSFRKREITLVVTRYMGSCGRVPPTGSVLMLDALLRVTATLQMEPQRRKAILLVHSGFPTRTERGMKNTCEDLLSKRFQSEALRANINLYGIDPGAPPGAPPDRLVDLTTLAEGTGGRVIEAGKKLDPETRVPGIFEEDSSYYLLGFRSTDGAVDDRFRRLEVKVNRPGVQVRTRSGYYANRSAPDSATKRSNRPAASPLEATVGGLRPTPDMPLRVSAAPFAIARKPGAAIALAIGLSLPASSSGATATQVNLLAHAYNLDGRSVGFTRMTISPSRGTGHQPFEALLRLEVPPGRYEVRAGVETSNGQRGSVYAYVDVPNFTKAPLSLSGVILDRAPAASGVPKDAFAGLLPISMTTDREFGRTDMVRAFMRVHQSGKPTSALVSARIVNERDENVFEETTTLSPDRFAARHPADYMLTLPLSRLPPGEYLLTVQTTLDKHQDQRDVRFTVR